MENGRIVEIDVTINNKVVAWCHMHVSVNAGMYGHQIAIRFNDERLEDGYKEYKTAGCGYCKETSAFEHFLSELIGGHVSLGGSCDYMLKGTKYHKGGNYYRVPLTVIRKLVKNRGL